jgi:hypothetical protein
MLLTIDGLQPLNIAADQDKPTTFSCELAGNRLPQPAGGACDKDCFFHANSRLF